MERIATTQLWVSRMIIVLGVIIAITILSSCGMQSKQYQAPVFEDIGSYKMDASFKSKDAKRFFDQGMIFTYGYNHGEAVRSFKEAIRLDSSYAMAYWGLAYALGPNYNAPMEEGVKQEAIWATKKAVLLKDHLSEWEKGLVEASALKYIEGLSNPDLNAFSQKMKALAMKFPENFEILTHYGESLMLMHPWDLYDYKGGPAKPWTPEIINVLNKSLQLNSSHPLTNHLFIHATEASDLPQLGLKASSVLSELIIPGAGHLVHMPSHTYINTGDYHLGTEVNLLAVESDSIYTAQCESQGAFPLYHYHNYHFLAACAALEGRGALAIESSFKMTSLIDQSLLDMAGLETTQHFMTVPYNVLVKFGQWEKILTLPKPDTKFPYIVSIWHYARGMAYANLNADRKAKEELDALKETQDGAGFSDFFIFGINTGQMVVDISMKVLEAEVLQRNGDWANAEKLYLEAIAIEDSMKYNEPPDWFFSVRHLLGDLYMRNNKYSEAEQVYRDDLKNFPKNGFALNGLFWSLIQQYKLDEAKIVRQAADKAWSYSDIKIKYSRVDPAHRSNLSIRIDPNDPRELILVAMNTCGFK